MQMQEKYNSSAAALFREKVLTEAQGGTWDESKAKKTVKQSRAAAKAANESSRTNNNSLKGYQKSPSTPTFQNTSANCGSYSSGGGGYQSQNPNGDYNYDSAGSSSYQNGASTKLTFADKKKMENSSRSSDLRPSGMLGFISVFITIS
jgi:hypothetical protein